VIEYTNYKPLIMAFEITRSACSAVWELVPIQTLGERESDPPLSVAEKGLGEACSWNTTCFQRKRNHVISALFSD